MLLIRIEDKNFSHGAAAAGNRTTSVLLLLLLDSPSFLYFPSGGLTEKKKQTNMNMQKTCAGRSRTRELHNKWKPYYAETINAGVLRL